MRESAGRAIRLQRADGSEDMRVKAPSRAKPHKVHVSEDNPEGKKNSSTSRSLSPQSRASCAAAVHREQRGARSMGLPEPARGYLTGVANNPRSGWLEYFGCAPRKRTEPASRVAS